MVPNSPKTNLIQIRKPISSVLLVGSLIGLLMALPIVVSYLLQSGEPLMGSPMGSPVALLALSYYSAAPRFKKMVINFDPKI